MQVAFCVFALYLFVIISEFAKCKLLYDYEIQFTLRITDGLI